MTDETSSRGSIQFGPSFDGTNFAAWRRSMLAFMILKKLKTVVISGEAADLKETAIILGKPEGSPKVIHTSNANNECAATLLKEALKGDTTRHVDDLKSAKAIFDKLERIYGNKSTARKLELEEQFASFRMNPVNIEAQLLRFKGIIQDLRDADIGPGEESINNRLLNAIPPSLIEFRSALMMKMQTKLRDLRDEVKEINVATTEANAANGAAKPLLPIPIAPPYDFIIEEIVMEVKARERILDSEHALDATKPSATALYMNGNNGHQLRDRGQYQQRGRGNRWSGSRGRGRGRSYNHQMREEPPRDERNGQESKSSTERERYKKKGSYERRCFICRSSEHLALQCPDNPHANEIEPLAEWQMNVNGCITMAEIDALLAVPGISEKSWLMDTGATRHFSNVRPTVNYRELETPITVKGLSKSSSEFAIGVGDLPLKLRVDGKIKDFTLFDALYVPDGRVNLFSLGLAYNSTKPYRIIGENGRLDIVNKISGEIVACGYLVQNVPVLQVEIEEAAHVSVTIPEEIKPESIADIVMNYHSSLAHADITAHDVTKHSSLITACAGLSGRVGGGDMPSSGGVESDGTCACGVERDVTCRVLGDAGVSDGSISGDVRVTDTIVRDPELVTDHMLVTVRDLSANRVPVTDVSGLSDMCDSKIDKAVYCGDKATYSGQDSGGPVLHSGGAAYTICQPTDPGDQKDRRGITKVKGESSTKVKMKVGLRHGEGSPVFVKSSDKRLRDGV